MHVTVETHAKGSRTNQSVRFVFVSFFYMSSSTSSHSGLGSWTWWLQLCFYNCNGSLTFKVNSITVLIRWHVIFHRFLSFICNINIFFLCTEVSLNVTWVLTSKFIREFFSFSSLKNELQSQGSPCLILMKICQMCQWYLYRFMFFFKLWVTVVAIWSFKWPIVTWSYFSLMQFLI